MVISNCRLCDKQKELCNSHIISDFFFELIRDKSDRTIQIRGPNIKKKKTYAGRKEKLVTEPLLCKDCETWRSKHENYAKNVLEGSVGVTCTPRPDELFLHNIDYKSFKLFLLSTLWLASITNIEWFSEINIGKHEDIIKSMLQNESPGRYFQYGCILLPVMKSDNETLFDLVTSPDKIKRDSHTIYRFVMGGFIWLFVVSSHTESLSQKEFFLQENGDLRIPLASGTFEKIPFIRSAIDKNILK